MAKSGDIAGARVGGSWEGGGQGADRPKFPDKKMSKSNGIAKVRRDRGQGAVQSKAPSGKMPKSDGIAGVRGNWSGGGGSGRHPVASTSRKNGEDRWHCESERGRAGEGQ